MYLSIRISFITLDINSVITLHRGSTYQGNSNFLQSLKHTGCHAILVNILCWLKTQGQMSIFTLCLWRTVNLKSFCYKTFSSSAVSSKLSQEIENVIQLFKFCFYIILNVCYTSLANISVINSCSKQQHPFSKVAWKSVFRKCSPHFLLKQVLCIDIYGSNWPFFFFSPLKSSYSLVLPARQNDEPCRLAKTASSWFTSYIVWCPNKLS